MITFLNNKFDLIVSIGEDCACTSYLRRCNLQKFSYPFDWLTKAPLENRIDLIYNNFKNFLNIEDLKPIIKIAHNENDKIYDLYENIQNGLHFYHDFPIGLDLEESHKIVFTKYQRRIKRFYDQIEKSQKILFVWFSHSKFHSQEEIIDAYKKLEEKFSDKDVYLLIIENSSEKNIVEIENNHIAIIHQETISVDKNDNYDRTMGNKANNHKIFKKIKIKRSFYEKIKNFLYVFCKLIINLVPIKILRSKAKQKLNMFFYHAKL